MKQVSYRKAAEIIGVTVQSVKDFMADGLLNSLDVDEVYALRDELDHRYQESTRKSFYFDEYN